MKDAALSENKLIATKICINNRTNRETRIFWWTEIGVGAAVKNNLWTLSRKATDKYNNAIDMKMKHWHSQYLF